MEIERSSIDRARLPRVLEKAKRLFDRGWTVVFVLLPNARKLRTLLDVPTNATRVAGQIVTLCKKLRENPSLRGQYLVVWGGNEPAPPYRFDLEKLPRIDRP